MIIKSIELENIRSYIKEIVRFPKGTILLSGDIGSGKSTILLSIEFALFGFKKPEITGSTLLRHGENNASVSLSFNIDNNEYTIKRVLKRSKNGIKQDNGYLITNEKKEDLTPVELKSKVLTILGYPDDLLARSKESIFRYTVYTPQEDMKEIIFADTENRLNILRRVFGIDRYRTIKDNLIIFLRDLRKKISYTSGQTEDIKEFENQKKELENNYKINEKEYVDVLNKEKIIEKDLESRKKKLDEFEEIKKEYDRFIQEKNLLQIKKDQLKTKINSDNIKIEENSEKISSIDDSSRKLEENDIDDIDKKILDIDSKLKELRDKQILAKSKIAVLDNQKNEKINLIEKIGNLENCPTCRQVVSKDHKKEIKDDSDKLIKENDEKITRYKEHIKKIEHNINVYEQKIKNLQKIRSDVQKNKLLSESLKEKKIENEKLSKEIKKDNETIKEYDKKTEDLDKKISDYKIRLKDYPIIKQDFEKQNSEYNIIIKKSSTLKEKLLNIHDQKELIIKKIDQKNELIRQNQKRISYLNIFNHSGLNLINLIEKQVLGTIHHEFNELTSNWFNLLIEDDIINLKLDSEFNPLIEQNGYDVGVYNLSGGEKTAVALSYRLALNKVINDMISSIKTKDLLILDEPTDGFSNEQLDRIKDVFQEVNVKQLIVVSHDPKVEGFVNNIINIQKQDHVSKVLV